METTIRKAQFATLAIGATAQRMGITDTELFNRLKRHGLVRRLLFDCYDTLHAESIDGVVWNVQEALKRPCRRHFVRVGLVFCLFFL